MHDVLAERAVAKQPTQERARARFERVLAEAEKMLEESGLEGFSIPVLAERVGYTRGSVYSYFPTPHALLNELARRNLEQLERSYVEDAAALSAMSWRKAIEAVIHRAAEFHNSRPAARLLLLSGAVADDSYRAQEMTIKRLGDLGRMILKGHGISLPARSPDVATLSVDIAVACLRRSVFDHGQIVPSYRDAAVRAMICFLEPYVESATKRRKP